MPSIAAAVAWAVNIANDDTHGYDQQYRTGPDYDCSSFVAAALIAGGFNISPTSYTGNLAQQLLAAGFASVPISAVRKPGDIFLVHHTSGDMRQHVLMCVDAANVVEATTNENGTTTGGQTGDQTGTEIYVHPYVGGSWDYHFTYGATPVTATWHCKATGPYNKESVEAFENACMVYFFLYDRGWTLNAVAGLLGNIGYEGAYNPWRWESDNVLASTDTAAMQDTTQHGYGLVQFTPSAKYALDAAAQAYSGFGVNFSDVTGSINDGDAQLQYIDEQPGYQSTPAFPMTYAQYKGSNDPPETCAEIWLYNYERPGNPAATVDGRKREARYWYDALQGIAPIPKTRRRMPIMFYLKRREY